MFYSLLPSDLVASFQTQWVLCEINPSWWMFLVEFDYQVLTLMFSTDMYQYKYHNALWQGCSRLKNTSLLINKSLPSAFMYCKHNSHYKVHVRFSGKSWDVLGAKKADDSLQYYRSLYNGFLSLSGGSKMIEEAAEHKVAVQCIPANGGRVICAAGDPQQMGLTLWTAEDDVCAASECTVWTWSPDPKSTEHTKHREK